MDYTVVKKTKLVLIGLVLGIAFVVSQHRTAESSEQMEPPEETNYEEITV